MYKKGVNMCSFGHSLKLQIVIMCHILHMISVVMGYYTYFNSFVLPSV